MNFIFRRNEGGEDEFDEKGNPINQGLKKKEERNKSRISSK